MATARGVTTRSRSSAAVTGVVTCSAAAKAAASASRSNAVHLDRGNNTSRVRGAAAKRSGRRKRTAAEGGGNENKPRQKKHRGSPPVSTPRRNPANGKGPSGRRSAKAAASNVAGVRTLRAGSMAVAETIPTVANGNPLTGGSVKEEHEDTHGTSVSIPTAPCVAPPQRLVPRVPSIAPPGFPIPTVLTPRTNPANGKPPTGTDVKEEHEDTHGTFVPIPTLPSAAPPQRVPPTAHTGLPIPPSAPRCSVSPISLEVPHATSVSPSLIATPVLSSSSSSSTPRPHLQWDGIIRSPAPHLTRYRSPAPHLSCNKSTVSIRLPYPSSLRSQSPSPGAPRVTPQTPVSLHGVSTSSIGIKEERASPSSTLAVNGAAPTLHDVQPSVNIKKEE